MKKFFILANWKANALEPNRWFKEFGIFNLKFENKIEIAIAPPYPIIPVISSKFIRASQDVSQYSSGAYTGEITANQLADLSVKYCLVGHSERRKYFGETNLVVEKKMSQAIKAGIIPIICAQAMEEIPANIRNYSPDKFLIMYEPFSAISTDGLYNPENPEKIIATLSNWKTKLNLNSRFLYGGSVSPDDVSKLTANLYPLISGFVVGHASLAAETFFAIINKCLQTLPSA